MILKWIFLHPNQLSNPTKTKLKKLLKMISNQRNQNKKLRHLKRRQLKNSKKLKLKSSKKLRKLKIKLNPRASISNL